jgi:hypothetical protein
MLSVGYRPQRIQADIRLPVWGKRILMLLHENSARQVAQIIAEAKSNVKRLDSQAQAIYNECRMTSAERRTMTRHFRPSTFEIRPRKNQTMRRRSLASRGVITLVLILQPVPLVLFPLESLAPTTQEGGCMRPGRMGCTSS